ncbi:MAG: hypothetical protein V8Q79_00230 [Christensenellales bacterium]
MDGMDGAARACICDHVYYLAMCVRESENETLTENNTVIEYDTERGTFMLRKGIRVKDFFAINGRVYYTQAESPYEVLLYNARENEEAIWICRWSAYGKRRGWTWARRT